MALKNKLPGVFVFLISVVVGLLMVIVFRYTSDQKAIRIAKDRLQAHLLALRLFQDQITVVLRSYGQIVLATGAYLRLAFKPLLIVIVPLTLLIVQLDRYLGYEAIHKGESFLVKARLGNPHDLNGVALHLPEGLAATAPTVHVPSENEAVWRVMAARNGDYVVKIQTSDRDYAKSVVVESGLSRLSPVRLRGKLLERVFLSAEPAMPANSPIEAIEVQYPPRNISFAGIEWTWIWLFFVLSLAAGFAFKTILRIEI
ncbi:MAG: hypothetical protein ABSD20_12510 [Terriglobales bacterium]|jgi:uncharacterized membrane protein (DUF106 family)